MKRPACLLKISLLAGVLLVQINHFFPELVEHHLQKHKYYANKPPLTITCCGAP